jgi:hypothetical protein
MIPVSWLHKNLLVLAYQTQKWSNRINWKNLNLLFWAAAHEHLLNHAPQAIMAEYSVQRPEPSETVETPKFHSQTPSGKQWLAHSFCYHYQPGNCIYWHTTINICTEHPNLCSCLPTSEIDVPPAISSSIMLLIRVSRWKVSKIK